MSQPYIGQIMMFGGNFAPAGWAFCQGQLLPISENDALFNLIGTTYGGDGQETFALPNLSSRIPVHQGQGSGLSNYVLGQASGTEQVTLNTQQIPVHNHMMMAVSAPGNTNKPQNNAIMADQAAQVPGGGAVYCYAPPGGATQQIATTSIQPSGGNQPHSNVQPVMGINYIISLYGVYPTPT